MALILNQTFKGTTATYWKILASDENYVDMNTVIEIALYYNKEARIEDINNFLLKEHYFIPDTNLSRQDQYDHLKSGNYSPIAFSGPGTNKFSLAQDN